MHMQCHILLSFNNFIVAETRIEHMVVVTLAVIGHRRQSSLQSGQLRRKDDFIDVQAVL